MKKIIIPTILIALITSIISVWGINQVKEKGNFLDFKKNTKGGLVHFASYDSDGNNGAPTDFSYAAENAVKSVVHINTKIAGKTIDLSDDPFARFFGLDGKQYKQPDQRGSGSGVIVTQDGYIVTNYHVVQGADEVQVTFNNRITKTAKVVGTDASTDLAVLKIDGSNYPYLNFGNSDQVKLGQWVLAVGYPLTLDATVTAGIVSAKSRNIGINRRNSNTAIESFIQTDAAVNMGNSGGALVNTDGQLIGINSAIASPTGTYAGYSYAIPSNLVKKVTEDIIEFGEVKRGYLGAQLLDMGQISQEQAGELGISQNDYINSNGVYLADVIKNSGASEAGLKKGDFITAINNVKVSSTSQLMEQVAQYHPGDKINVEYTRNGKPYNTQVTLKSHDKMEALIAGSTEKAYNQNWGATFETLSAEVAGKYGIKGGVKVSNIDPNGEVARMTDIKEGFIITSINDNPISNTQQLLKALNTNSRINIGGVYPGRNGRYYYGYEAQ